MPRYGAFFNGLLGVTESPDSVLVRTMREESGRILAGLIRRLGGDFFAAEDALQEACASALQTWLEDGIPESPGACLMQVALRKSFDAVRRTCRRSPVAEGLDIEGIAQDEHERARQLERLEETMESAVEDDLLRLMFTCCHPALALDARVALTLRTLGGLTTAEIARALLVPEATLAQRLVRAQQKIQQAGIPYRIPRQADLPERLEALLAVLYLIFNEGYASAGGERFLRVDLCEEAIRLARLLARLLPEQAEPMALLALLLLQHSRHEAREAPDGSFHSLETQDRTHWNHQQITEGLRALGAAASMSTQGRYLLQAQIAAEHAIAGHYQSTNWRAIVGYYERLLAADPSPVVALNHAAALAMLEGPEAGLAQLDQVLRTADGALDTYPWMHSLRGELLARSGRPREARAALMRALDHCRAKADRLHLQRRLIELGTA